MKVGIDTNGDGKITKRELYYVDYEKVKRKEDAMDLTNAGITNISGIEYLSYWYIDLSGNNISDITPITKNKTIYGFNLSNNNITDISGIENADISQINLSNNKIVDITPTSNLYHLNTDRDYRYVDIDLSNNQISNIDCVKTWKNLATLNLSKNKITNIQALKDYNFKMTANMTEEEINNLASGLTIDLTNNKIDMTLVENKAAKEVFDKRGANLKVVEDGKRVEYTVNDASNSEEIINAMDNAQNVILDMKEEAKEISSSVFENLAKKEDVNLKIQTENANWKFSSSDINKSNIKLDPTVIISDTKFEDMSKPPFEDAIYVKFEHEGDLPGKAEIELDISKYNIYDEGKTVYLYYFDSINKQYKYISTMITTDEKVTIILDHCSEYVISDKMLYTLGDVDQNGKIDAQDAVMILKHVAHNITLDSTAFQAADTTKDGEVNAQDAVQILKYVAHNINEF